jgi:DNA polymerase-3 subunit delta
MPRVTPASVRQQIAAGDTAPLYVLLGADDAEKSAMASEFASLVEEGLQAFNVERLYGGEIKLDGLADIACTLPMMAPRRVVIVLEAEKLFVPKREGKAADEEQARLIAFLQDPPPHATIVFVCAALDQRRKVSKVLLDAAHVVNCGAIDNEADAERWVRARAGQDKVTLEPAAIRALVARTGLDIVRLRSGLERVALYAMGQPAVTARDVEEVIPLAPDAQEDFGIANAIGRGDVRNALKELGLALDAGAVPFFVMGQIRFAAEKLPASRVRGGIDAVYRTDLALKSSGGDPRILLERLVMELCGAGGGGRAQSQARYLRR